MSTGKNKSLLVQFRTGNCGRTLLFFTTINFINLTVNFTEEKKKLEDPVDTISEMIYEWGLDGDSDTIPDNATEQEDQTLKKLKLISTTEYLINWLEAIPYLWHQPIEKPQFLFSIFISLGTPPPDEN